MLNKSEYSSIPFFKVGIICLAVGLITIFHYITAPEAGIRHVIFRELYYLPIILGGFWFGIRGGLATALAISILYGPLVFMISGNLSTHDFGNIMEIFLFILIGGLLGWLRDRQTAQQNRLREAESLAAMGRATTMIAHDLKTPLVTIGGLARQLNKKITPGTSEEEKVRIIRQQTGRLEQLVADMLIFAKPLQLSLAPHNLCLLLEKARESVSETALHSQVAIDLPAEDSRTCHLDYDKMMLVLINLFANAIEASPSKGTVSVSLRHYEKELCIDVSDRGPGIPEDIRQRIFEPFVTGKKKGTGLGLSICRKIIEAHTGTLTYRTNPSSVTTFTISLPYVHGHS